MPSPLTCALDMYLLISFSFHKVSPISCAKVAVLPVGHGPVEHIADYVQVHVEVGEMRRFNRKKDPTLVSPPHIHSAPDRLRLESFPRSVSSSIFCMGLLSAFNNARFKFQGSGSNTLEVMSICLNYIKLKKFQENI